MLQNVCECSYFSKYLRVGNIYNMDTLSKGIIYILCRMKVDRKLWKLK